MAAGPAQWKHSFFSFKATNLAWHITIINIVIIACELSAPAGWHKANWALVGFVTLKMAVVGLDRCDPDTLWFCAEPPHRSYTLLIRVCSAALPSKTLAASLLKSKQLNDTAESGSERLQRQKTSSKSLNQLCSSEIWGLNFKKSSHERKTTVSEWMST